jgi:hypothetical protein
MVRADRVQHAEGVEKRAAPLLRGQTQGGAGGVIAEILVAHPLAIDGGAGGDRVV